MKRRVKIASEGTGILSLSAGGVVLSVVVSLMVPEGRMLWLPAFTGVLFLGIVHFFRDPERFPPLGSRLILSPADGRIIAIERDNLETDERYCSMISIFMSPLDVHINRSPIDGKVTRVEHRSGKFYTAFRKEAARENEQTWIEVEGALGRVAFRQVVGFLARRIVCHLKTAQYVKAGERIGMIRFGSRVDLFVPANVRLSVNTGDRVLAGESVIGEFIGE
ncbi:MAG: phosphatidylserine decarboxylase [bacterium]